MKYRVKFTDKKGFNDAVVLDARNEQEAFVLARDNFGAVSVQDISERLEFGNQEQINKYTRKEEVISCPRCAAKDERIEELEREILKIKSRIN